MWHDLFFITIITGDELNSVSIIILTKQLWLLISLVIIYKDMHVNDPIKCIWLEILLYNFFNIFITLYYNMSVEQKPFK